MDDKVFFNQLIAAFCGWKDERNDPSNAIRHGDGTPLDAEAVGVAVELAEELAFDLHWQVGDVVLVDNMIAMHARRPFVGTRKVVASLAEMETQCFSAGCVLKHLSAGRTRSPRYCRTPTVPPPLRDTA